MPSTSGNAKTHAAQNRDYAHFDVAVPKAPVTYRRTQAVNSDDKLEKPGVARANTAVSRDKPEGEPEQVKKYQDYVRLHPPGNRYSTCPLWF